MAGKWKSRLTASQITVIVLVSTKEEIMNQNEFKLNGVAYVAIDAIVCCSKCEIGLIGKCSSKSVPPCGFASRTDRREVIFVEKPE